MPNASHSGLRRRRSKGLPVDVDAGLLGTCIRERRTALGLTQAQVAAPVATAAYLSRIEAGDRAPGFDFLNHIAEVLECTADELLDEATIDDHRGRRMDSNLALGRAIRERRIRRGLTQYDLAGGGVTGAHISRIESGDRRPSVELLEQLASKLGTDAETLMGSAHSTEARAIRSMPADYLAAKRVANAAAAWHAEPTVRHYELLLSAVTAWTSTTAAQQQSSTNEPSSPA